MSAILPLIDEIYSAENKRGSVWAKTPSQTLIDRVPGLLDNETVLRARRQSIAVIIGPLTRCIRSIFCYGLLAIASPIPILARACFIAMLGWTLYLAVITWGWNFTLIAVTNWRVIIREGWLTRLVKPVPLRQIADTTVRQRKEWETLLDVGDVTLEVLAENDPKFTLLEEPYEFRRLLQYTKDAVDDWLYKKRRTEMSDWLGDYLMPGEAGG